MSRKVVASLYVTLDGFIDQPGLWSFPFWSEEAGQFKARELSATDALLLGRIEMTSPATTDSLTPVAVPGL